MTDASVRFDEHQIRLIIKALPDGISARRLQLLPSILSEWSGDFLRWSLHRVDPAVAKGRAKQLEAIAKHAGELSRALDEFSHEESWLVFEFAKRISPMGFQDEVSGQRKMLKDRRKFLGDIEAIAVDLAGAFKRSIDQRRNIPAYRVMLDIQAIFEWLTKTKATRRVEYGSRDVFGDFVRSIWPVVFEKGDDGVDSALKNWAKWTKDYGDASALIANIDLSHPEWRVFKA
jgi:hypothetical protein